MFIMYFPILALLCISLYYVESHSLERSTGAVKWRIFNGKDFPENSLEVGFENDKKVYIGLNSVAGKVIEDRLLLEYVKYEEYRAETKNFWILTDDQSVRLEWVLFSYEYPIPIPRFLTLVPVGQTGGEKYIALAGNEGNHTIGTLYCNSFPYDCEPMYAINRYGKVERYDYYQLLAYRDYIKH